MAQVQTVAFLGIEAVPVEVQAQIAPGLPRFYMVGLPDKAVKEATERVRAALFAAGLGLPPKRITVNLAPADLPKEGTHFDLPIALALMAAIGAIPSDALDGYLALGELALDGRITPTAGTLPAAIAAQGQNLGIVCAGDAGPEAAWAGEDLDIVATDSLLALVNHLAGHQLAGRPSPRIQQAPAGQLDLADIRGQETARRALEVAAAGGHNLLQLCSKDPSCYVGVLRSRCCPNLKLTATFASLPRNKAGETALAAKWTQPRRTPSGTGWS